MSKRSDRIRELIESRSTLQLATLDDDGAPLASYAPYVIDDRGIFVYLSRLAAHTGNLLANPTASVLFIEDEADCENVFARRRAGFQCAVTTVPRDSGIFNRVLDLFVARFGDTAATIRALPDFVLFRLDPVDGSYVEGFGRAYQIRDLANLDSEHRRP